MVVMDEISMVGKQMMGKISARFRQAKTKEQNPHEDALGGLFFIGVGDPARCPPISDEPFFDAEPHKATRAEGMAPHVLFSNAGKLIYDSFEEVVILQFCHRVHRRSGCDLTTEFDYNEQGNRFLEVMKRFRDCTWTEDDFYWLGAIQSSTHGRRRPSPVRPFLDHFRGLRSAPQRQSPRCLPAAAA